MNCGHLCACNICANKMENKCPICKQIGLFKRIFVS